jgi:D-alanyl-D-alanine carboxypeptidase
MMRKLLLLFIITACFIPAAIGQTFNNVKLDSLFDVLAAHNQAMLSISISQNGKTIYNKSIGYSVLGADRKIPATAQTHYRIGSISKMFTAVMIFQLIDEGKLTLTTPLSAFFADLPNANKITIANLLNHSSGLHNFTNDTSYQSMMVRKTPHAELLTRFRNTRPDFEPGSKHEYSNTNFVLLGYIVEKLDKKDYAIALNERILTKAGLKDTYYGNNINPERREAYSYSWNGSWQITKETDMSIPGGAGGIESTPADLNRFIEALFAGKLISESDLNNMKTIKDGFGMAMFPFPFYTKVGYGHNGAIDGFLSVASYFPEDKLAISYTANGVNTDLNNVMIAVLSAVFNKPFAIPFYPGPEVLDKYTGIYGAPLVPVKITVARNAAGLTAQATGQSAFPLTATSNNTFRFDAAGIEILFNDTNKQLTIVQAGRSTVFTKEN